MKQPNSNTVSPMTASQTHLLHLTDQDITDLRHGTTGSLTRRQLIDNARLVGNPTPACMDGLVTLRHTHKWDNGKNRPMSQVDSPRARRRALIRAMMEKKLDR